MELPLVMPDQHPANGAIELRAFNVADVSMVMDLSTDPYLPMIGSLPPHTDRAGALAYLQRQESRLETGAGYSFCAALSATGEAVGQAGLWLSTLDSGRASAGYCVAPRFRRRGFGGQALKALTEFGWTVPDLYRIELYIEPWNVGSTGVAEAAGYQYEGTLRSHQEIGGQRVDMALYAAVRPTRP